MNTKWIGYISDKNYKNINQFDSFGAVAQYYRKTFELKEKPLKASLKISSLSIFKAYINGQSVSEELFAPGWTNYNKRIFYREYDVTKLLNDKNAIAVCVGDGWYAGYISIKGRQLYGNYPLSLYASLTLTFKDGSTLTVDTNESWKAGEGAIRQNDFLGGEVFDDRLPHVEISNVDFDDSTWQNAFIAEDKSALLDYCDYEPIVMHENLKATLVSKQNNQYIYDLGQNFAGLVSIVAEGESGSEIVIRHGEMLDNGALYTENLRTAKATDKLILSGKQIEYTPTMTYHGFRYVEITVSEGAQLISVCGRAIYNDLKTTGDVTTSNQLVNKIISCVKWGMKSNFVDLPTDCPQRNERLGWSGDTQVFSRSAMYFADCRKFYNKYLITLDDDRRGGEIPDVIPHFGVAGFDHAFWRDVAIVLPFNLYEMYGDAQQVKQYLPFIKDYLDLQMQTAVDYTWEKSNYNDWLNIDENSPEDSLATCGNAYCFALAIKLFTELGEDCEKYKEFLDNIKRSFVAHFIADDGSIKGGTQTLYALSYRANLISAQQAKKGLEICFAKRNDHIHSGFCGIRFILPVLCDLGLVDLAYKLVTNDTFPSWGYSVVNGATTIWERWDSYVKGKGFGDKTMNSFNHYSLGSCGEWFFEYVLGIKPKKAGFDGVIIKPFVDRSGKIDGASGSFESINGKICVEWKKCSDGFYCKIEKAEQLKADFVFENVQKIVQDGVTVDRFDANKKVTEIYFK